MGYRAPSFSLCHDDIFSVTTSFYLDLLSEGQLEHGVVLDSTFMIFFWMFDDVCTVSVYCVHVCVCESGATFRLLNAVVPPFYRLKTAQGR